MSTHFGYSPIDIEKKVSEIIKKHTPSPTTTQYLLDIDVGSPDNVLESYGNGSVRSLRGKTGVLYQRSDSTLAPFIDGVGNDTHIDHRGVNKILHFSMPRMRYPDISAFVVVDNSDPVKTRRWQTIIGNDDGGYDKYVGYRGTNFISYGGSTGREGICALPSDIDITKKHLVSIHWFMEEGHIRINGTILDNSEFTTNALATGHPYGTLFGAHRELDNGGYHHIHTSRANLYGIMMTTGYMTDTEISDVSSKLMKKYSIIK